MKKNSIVIFTGALLLSVLASVALAQVTPTPKAQYATESKQALARYNADKALCADEASATARLQCRRDAKAEYDKVMAAAKAQLTASSPGTVAASGATVACVGCGKVTAVSTSEKAGEGGALGIIAGGATGAVIGHQVGGGVGKDLATIAGAVGGAYAGKKIEEKAKSRTVWTVRVQLDDGSQSTFNFDRNPGFKIGELVKKSGSTLVRQ